MQYDPNDDEFADTIYPDVCGLYEPSHAAAASIRTASDQGSSMDWDD